MEGTGTGTGNGKTGNLCIKHFALFMCPNYCQTMAEQDEGFIMYMFYMLSAATVSYEIIQTTLSDVKHICQSKYTWRGGEKESE